MERIKIVVYSVCILLSAVFLTACSSWQMSNMDSGPVSYSGGHGGHH